jgi:hypothetical protein
VDGRERRLAQNESLFREVNERIKEVATDQAVAASYAYVCECANSDCTFQVELDHGEYEAVRQDPAQFVVLPRHYTPEIEDLVAEHESHWIVRKKGEAAEYVERLDPRSR